MDSIEIKIHEDFTPELLNKFEAQMRMILKPCVCALDIKSYGGRVDILESMVNIISQKKQQGCVFITNVNEYAYSAGFMLFLVGDMKFVSENAVLMYHSAGVVIEDERLCSEDAKQIYETLVLADQISDKIILENTNLSTEMFSILKKNTTFFNRNDLIFLGVMEEEYNL